MGAPFRIKIKIPSLTNGTRIRWEKVDVLVDSGATYTSLPRTLLKRLRTKVEGRKALRLANGSVIEREFGFCRFQVENEPAVSIVLFADKGDLPLLGMNTLDEVSLAIDPVNKRLIPVQAIQASYVKSDLVHFTHVG